MADDNELKPLDISKVKSATSRIDLSKATIPASPAATPSGIRLGVNPKKATSRIDISTIPGAAKAQTSQIGIGAMPPPDEDIFKRRTALLDTSKIPLGTAAPTPQPRTIRIGARPTVRVAAAATPVAAAAPVSEPEAAGGRPTIKLKRPGGGVAITVPAAPAAPAPAVGGETFIIQEEGPGALWAVFSLLSMLLILGLIVIQIMTIQGAAY